MSNHKQNSRLLSLPGEIRNRIYEFVTSSKRDRLFVHLPGRDSEKDRSYHGLNYSYVLLQSLGLMQTCQLLRSEYLPLAAHPRQIYVSFRDAICYSEDFVQPQLKRNPLHQAEIIVVAEIKTDDCTVDLRGLILLASESPKFTLVLRSYNAGYHPPWCSGNLNLKVATDSAWYQHLFNAVTRIDFISKFRHNHETFIDNLWNLCPFELRDITDIAVWVRPEYEEDWMVYQEDLDWEENMGNYEDGRKQWSEVMEIKREDLWEVYVVGRKRWRTEEVSRMQRKDLHDPEDIEA